MKAKDEKTITQTDLIRLALKLREDLFNLAETHTNSQDLARVLDSAGALISAITDSNEIPRYALPPAKTAQMYSFARRRRIAPMRAQ